MKFNRIIGEKILKTIKKKFTNIVPVGSIGRSDKLIGDVDFITKTKLNDIIKYIKSKFEIIKEVAIGEKVANIIIKYENKKIPINIWKYTKVNRPFIYFNHAYQKAFVIAIKNKFKKQGWKFGSEDLIDNNGKKIKVTTYRQIFKYLDIPFRTPNEQYLKSIIKLDKKRMEQLKRLKQKKKLIVKQYY